MTQLPPSPPPDDHAERPPQWRQPSDGEWRLLDWFVSEDLGADEREAMAALVSRDPVLNDLAAIMRSAGAANDPAWNTERAWQALQVRRSARQLHPSLQLMASEDGDEARPGIRQPSVRTHQIPFPSSRIAILQQVPRWVRFGVFATVLLLCAGSVALVWRHSSSRDPSVQTSPVAMREFSTHVGQRARIQLTDGTMVTLGPQTRLQVSNTFGVKDRTITLQGEAFFEVAPDAALPMTVHMQGTIARVLGTQFNVRSYGQTTTLAVLEGKVALESERTDIPGAIVTAGYVAVMAVNGNVNVNQGDVERHIAWVRDRLSFRDTPVDDVLDDLSRWYGVQFIVPDSTAIRRRLTAEWENRSLESVLQSLSIALNVRMVRNGDEITLRPDS